MAIILSKEIANKSDEYTIHNLISEEDLIKKAGKAIFDAYDKWGKTLILVGKGNNGGDGLALAAILANNKIDVSILILKEITNPLLLKLFGEALHAGTKILSYDENLNFSSYDVIVDAIFGTGFHGELEGTDKIVVEKVNDSKTYKIAIDINSGLNSDNGRTKLAFKSDLTVAIGSYKPGHFLNDAKDYIGSLEVGEIGLVPQGETYRLYEETDLKNIFVPRKENIHKGSNGYVGIFGGSINYSGSVKLGNLAISALRVGTGVARVIVPDSIKDSVSNFLLESTLFPLPSIDGHFLFDEEKLASSIANLQAVAFGMGVTVNEEIKKILSYLFKNYTGKLLIDADGINALGEMDISMLDNAVCRIVLTPHVKEFSRLTHKSIDEILNNPLSIAKEYAKNHHVVMLLKGSATIITDGEKLTIVGAGSNALSKGGSGDILSGIIAGIMGYDNDLYEAASSGAYIHGRVGEMMEREYGAYDAIPRDEIECLKEFMKNR